jgi:hypothetical protein
MKRIFAITLLATMMVQNIQAQQTNEQPNRSITWNYWAPQIW